MRASSRLLVTVNTAVLRSPTQWIRPTRLQPAFKLTTKSRIGEYDAVQCLNVFFKMDRLHHFYFHLSTDFKKRHKPWTVWIARRVINRERASRLSRVECWFCCSSDYLQRNSRRRPSLWTVWLRGPQTAKVKTKVKASLLNDWLHYWSSQTTHCDTLLARAHSQQNVHWCVLWQPLWCIRSICIMSLANPFAEKNLKSSFYALTELVMNQPKHTMKVIFIQSRLTSCVT